LRARTGEAKIQKGIFQEAKREERETRNKKKQNRSIITTSMESKIGSSF
jgi:hypothetical protein